MFKIFMYSLCVIFIIIVILAIFLIIDEKHKLSLLRRAEPSSLNYIKQLTRYGYASLSGNDNNGNNTNYDFGSNYNNTNYDFGSNYNNSNYDFSSYYNNTNNRSDTNNNTNINNSSEINDFSDANPENPTNQEYDKFKNEKCLGDYAVSGIAKSTLSSPYSHDPCIFYEYKKEYICLKNNFEEKISESSDKKSASFELIDNDLQITVYPTDYSNDFYQCEEIETKEDLPPSKPGYDSEFNKHTEKIMRADQRITVYGSIFMNEKDEIYLKPSKKYKEFVATNKSLEDTIKDSSEFFIFCIILFIVCLLISCGLLYYILTRYWHLWGYGV